MTLLLEYTSFQSQWQTEAMSDGPRRHHGYITITELLAEQLQCLDMHFYPELRNI